MHICIYVYMYNVYIYVYMYIYIYIYIQYVYYSNKQHQLLQYIYGTSVEMGFFVNVQICKSLLKS